MARLPGKPLQRDGSFTLSRMNSNQPLDRPITFRIEDRLSGIEFCEVHVSLEDFAKAITGQGGIPCRVEVRGLHLVGKRRENKTEQVFVPDGPFETREARAKAAVAEHEVDGWRGRVGDATNSHNRISGGRDEGGYRMRVVFTRWVDEATGLPVASEAE